jgi:hypothetical protein
MSRPAQMSWDAKAIKEREHAAAVRGLDRAADHLLDAALVVTPIEFYDLVETGTASTDASQMRSAVSFDGPYSIWQHENLELAHDPGKSSKYLEEPFLAEKDEMLRIMADEIGQALR